jgi:adenine-specific DNA methylase
LVDKKNGKYDLAETVYQRFKADKTKEYLHILEK